MTDGRTYKIESTELHPDVKSGARKPMGRYYSRGNVTEYPTHEDYVLVETPFVVPNGKWVIEPPLVALSQPIGVGYDEIERIQLDKTRPLGTPGRMLYVSDKPFGLISCTYEDDPIFGWTGSAEKRTRYLVTAKSMYFHTARQIHKGELGQSVPVPRLGRYGVVTFREIAAELSITCEELLHEYRPFISWHLCEDIGVRSMPSSLDNYQANKGLANTILRLAALGYTSKRLPA